jgi:hypothetical protein
MSPCGVVNCKALGPPRPLLTNRMTQLVTYGSVGGVGGNPGPYPAGNSRRPFRFRRLREIRCSSASSEPSSPAAVAEGGR